MRMKFRLLLHLLTALLTMVASAAGNIVNCGYCVCERASITCDFDAAKTHIVDNVLLDQFVPTDAALRSLGLDPLNFVDLYVNCKNSRVLFNQRLTRRLLEPFAKMRKVAIVRCDLTAIDSDALQGLYDLEEFDASDNNLGLLPPRLFGHRKMTAVKLSENLQLQLDSQVFFGLTLQRLILSKCELEAFPLGALFPIEGLRELTLSENRIQFVPRKAASVIGKLSAFYLDGNPLSCTCGNKWLQESLNWTQLSPDVMRKSKLPTCKTPFNLMDIELTKVHAVEFGCSPPPFTDVELHLSQDAAVLQCTAAASAEQQQEMKKKKQQQQLSWSYQHLPGGPVLPGTAGLDTAGPRFAKTFRRTPGLATERFVIFASSVSDGQASSLNISIEWPPPPLPASGGDGASAAPAASSATSKRPPHQQQQQQQPPSVVQPTRLQPQSPGIPEENQHQPELQQADYYAAKQFTLVEMIVAVIGTFMATSLLFLLSCQFVRWYSRRDRKRWLPATSYGQHAYAAAAATAAIGGGPGGAVVYGYSPHHHHQLGAGSLSQHEYDVPRIDQPSLPRPPSVSAHGCGGGGSSEFLDFSNPRLKYNV